MGVGVGVGLVLVDVGELLELAAEGVWLLVTEGVAMGVLATCSALVTASEGGAVLVTSGKLFTN